ncbi:unnamed protein product [Caenorhabditis auriculariae]|uniref:NTF2-related export protein n=1 Tax=Caenorhabditis auriculariae TaxID=2777116 RepID=A0A8S1HVR3_9PELO|nr:unnamed protein product [Caenorhabditis auriculariae]
MDVANNKLDEEVCRDARAFVDIFYDTMDRKRDKIGFLYSEQPNLVWNGNPFQGHDSIRSYLQSLPETQHNLTSVDAQKLPGGAGLSESAILVTVAGETILGADQHAFSQTFVLICQDAKYKINSDRFRYLD